MTAVFALFVVCVEVVVVVAVADALAIGLLNALAVVSVVVGPTLNVTKHHTYVCRIVYTMTAVCQGRAHIP